MQSEQHPQVAMANQLGVSIVQPGTPSMDALFRQDSTLGQPVTRGVAVAADLKGKYMGDGTYTNAGRAFFSTKENVLMNKSWAQLFNQLFEQQSGTLQTAREAGFTDFSLGIAGTYPEGENVGVGYYVDGIKRYYNDDRARISISGMKDQNGRFDPRISPYTLPGSTASRAANALGYAIGLAYVKNPLNDTGYLRLGSKGWRDALTGWARQNTVAAEPDMQHLFGQGAVYGLGPVYRLFGINVVPLIDQTDQTGGLDVPVRFRVANQGVSLAQLINNDGFMRAMQSYYDTYLKNPDQKRLGRYGAASLFLRHADKMNTTGTGESADMNAINTGIMDAWQNQRPITGIAKWGKGRDGVNYADFVNRRGITANPLRDSKGNPVGKAFSKSTGNCNIWGSGPGVQQMATAGGNYGFKFTRKSVPYTSKRKGLQGEEIAPTTFRCANTPDFTVNPGRAIYQAGENTRATADMSLAEVLQAANIEGYNAQDLTARYADWVANPGKYGTNPYFMLPVASGRLGFSRAAPGMYVDAISKQHPESAAIYGNMNFTREQKLGRSDYLAGLATGAAPSAQFPKTSAPTYTPSQ